MSNRSLDTKMAHQRETTHGSGSLNWDGPSVRAFRSINPTVDGLKQQVVQDESYMLNPNDVHKVILGLQNGEIAFDMHVAPPNSITASGSTASADLLALLLETGMGGLRITPATSVYSCTGAHLSGNFGTTDFYQGDKIFLKDTSNGGKLELREVYAVSDSVMTLDQAPGFTVDSTDVIASTITNFVQWNNVTDVSSGSYYTDALYVKHLATDDIWSALNVKYDVDLDEVKAGQPIKASFKAHVGKFEHEGVTRASLTGTLHNNRPGTVAAIGSSSPIYYGDATGSMTSLTMYSAGPKVGLKHERIEGPNGADGLHQYLGKMDGAGLDATVNFSSSYSAHFRNGSEVRVMIQVGDKYDKAVGYYFPSLQHAENPTRVDTSGLATSKLTLKHVARTLQHSSSLTTDQEYNWYSPVSISRPA